MNLHAIASGAISAVNPFVPAQVRQSNGYTIGADYAQKPVYKAAQLTMQVQATGTKELQHIDALNLSGTFRKIYTNGALYGTQQVPAHGGDLIQLFNGPNVGVWLVIQVIEQWPDWCCILVQLQKDKSL